MKSALTFSFHWITGKQMTGKKYDCATVTDVLHFKCLMLTVKRGKQQKQKKINLSLSEYRIKYI